MLTKDIREAALTRLCYRDPRNPYRAEDIEGVDPLPFPDPDCACDNCFYGRTFMAYTILLLANEVDRSFTIDQVEAEVDACTDAALHHLRTCGLPCHCELERTHTLMDRLEDRIKERHTTT